MEGALDPINFGTQLLRGPSRGAAVDVDPVGRGARRRATTRRRGSPSRTQDGVDAEILYPTPRIGNQVVWHVSDPDFHLACIRAYNDWLSEYSRARSRPAVGRRADAQHRHRRRDRRAATRVRAFPACARIMLGPVPARRRPDGSAEDDAFWAAVQEAGLPMSIHVAFATEAQGDSGRMRLTGATRFYDAAGADPAVHRQRRVRPVPRPAARARRGRLVVDAVPPRAARRPLPAGRAGDPGPTSSGCRASTSRDNILTTFITDPYAIAEPALHRAVADDVVERLPAHGLRLAQLVRRSTSTSTACPTTKAPLLAGNALRLYGAPGG